MCLMPLFNLSSSAEDGSVFQGTWEHPQEALFQKAFPEYGLLKFFSW